MTEEEKEILEATKEFAEIHDIPYDDRIELMILNAMREVVKNCSIPVVVVPKGTLCLDCEKRPAVSGYDLHFCEECWNNAVD